MSPRRKQIAVVGSASADENTLRLAEEVGRLLVDRGHRVLTGGLEGVMEAAARGAKSSARAADGDTIGVLPTLDASTANPWVDIVVPTGMNFARNVVLVAMSDALVALGGGAGTLSEIALAWQHRIPVVALDTGAGWSSRLGGQSLDHRGEIPIAKAWTAEEAIARVEELLRGAPARNPGFAVGHRR
ncbi:TIGR00725 family protein [Archangium violaceum]|uniref:TIGR00725 family protein n=1 Tax=Archangium violaceum TaxID=83451 RepID=UPI0006966894|nr:TIGR00725 family protein [Archangium violaceum]